ncbi:MAG: hypothetical protein KF878_32225 [Planctomycetes bacterium]|nr:hypothetical protein [Planctomycetota bacterium]
MASTATGVAGCSGSKKTTIIGGGGRTPVIQSLSTQAAMTDGNAPGGTPIRLQIRGIDFDAAAQVRLAPTGTLTFDPSVATIDSATGTVLIPASNIQFHDQSRIDIIALPASPILGNNGEGTVIVQVVNPGNVVNTDGTSDGSATHDELTYYHNQGLQVAVTQTGPIAGAWSFVYPGQSGVELQATITNMTQEPVNTVALPERSLTFGPHVLNYMQNEPATTLAVGATTTVRFLAAFTNELPSGALTGTCGVTAVGATSGRSYTGTGGVSLTAGSTPTINTRGGNNQSDNTAAGNGGAITISSNDSNGAATAGNLGGLTIGAATPAIAATADAAAGVAADQADAAAARANLAAGNVTHTMTQAHVYVGTTIDITNANNTTWTFNGNFPVVFRNVTIRYGGATGAEPFNLTIIADQTLQFINCTIDLTDRRVNVPTAGLTGSGSLTLTAANAQAGRTLDLQGCTIRTNGVRGAGTTAINGTTAGSVVIQANNAASNGTNIIITNTTIDARGASMVNAVTLPGTGGTTTAGGAVTIQTFGNSTAAENTGQIHIDGQSVIRTSGGDGVGYTTGTGANGGAVTINSGLAVAANRRNVLLYGQINTRGGDALDAASGTGGAVGISGRVITIGNTEGRPVLMTNGGSSSIVGGQSLGGTATQLTANAGGNAGAISIGTDDTTNPMQGPITIAQGAGLIACGGGGDTGGGTGAAININVSRNDSISADASAQNIVMNGVACANGGWVRVTGTGGAANLINMLGNTNVTLGSTSVLLSEGGSPARSANTATPVGNSNNGGAGNTITVRSGLNDGAAANGGNDHGPLEINGLISTRGGFYTLETAPGVLSGAGGAGGNVILAGEGVRVTQTAKVVTDGGSCADAGQRNGGRAGAITVTSGYANGSGTQPVIPTTGGSGTGGAYAAGDSNLVIAGTLQADGGNISKGGAVVRATGNFSVTVLAATTVNVHWPNHGARTNDLVTVASAVANVNQTRVAVTVTDANNFTYTTAGATAGHSGVGVVTLFRQVRGHGGSNVITLRQDNVQLQTFAGNPRDAINITGSILARAGKVDLGTTNPLNFPGRILIFGSRTDGGNATNVGANITIGQAAVITAAGNNAGIDGGGNNVRGNKSLTISTEDVGVILVQGKVTVDNDRPAGEPSTRGSMLLEVINNPAGQVGRITVESTGEIKMIGGYAGADLDTIEITNATTGANTTAVNLSGTIRNEDETVDDTVTLSGTNRSGHGGVIVISAVGQVNHTAGEITARGTGSAAGHGGHIAISHTGGTGTEHLNLGGPVPGQTANTTGILRVDGGGPNGWAGRILLSATNAGTTGNPRIRVLGTYALSADGSGRGGGGLPAASSIRLASNGLGEGGIYIGNTANQVVNVATTVAITARGGNNTNGVRAANGTPLGGCLGGVVVFGEGQDLGELAINSSIDVSGGANGAGPGGAGGAINVRCSGGGATTSFGNAASVTWTADGGASTFPQSIGGVGGFVTVLVPNAAVTVNFGTTAPNRFAANLRGGAGTTLGGNGGVFDVNALAAPNTAAINFGATGNLATVAVTGGTGATAGSNGVVRLRKTTGGTAFGGVGGGTPTLSVEPAAALVVSQ